MNITYISKEGQRLPSESNLASIQMLSVGSLSTAVGQLPLTLGPAASSVQVAAAKSQLVFSQKRSCQAKREWKD